MKLEKHKRVYIPNLEDGLVEDYNIFENVYVLSENDFDDLLVKVYRHAAMKGLTLEELKISLTK